MKSIGKLALVAVLILSLGMFLSACSSKSSDETPATTTTTTTTTGGNTVTNAPATQQASTGTQAATMGSSSATTLNQFGLSQTVGAPRFKLSSKVITSPALQKAARFSGKLAKAPGVARAAAAFRSRTMNATTTGSAACTGGGTISYSLTSGSATSGTISMVFDACREEGTEMTGTAIVSVVTTTTGATYTETLGTTSSRLTMLAFSDNTYSVMVSKLSSAITMSMSGTATSANMSANGDMIITDYTSGGDVFTLVYSNTTFGIVETTSGSAITDVITMGGGMTETWTPAGGTLHSFAMTFSSFSITDVFASATAAAYDESISGGITIAMVPADCGDGSFTFATGTAVHYDANGISQSGQMTISATQSGVTAVVRITFLANGLITIEERQADGTFTTIQANVDPYSLANLCGVQTLDEPAPSSSGTGGTATSNASNAVMTATLSWDGTTSDMDLHMVHLTSAPTTTTIYTYNLTSHGATANSNWHLYYGSGPGGGCSINENYVGTSTSKVAVLDVDKCDGLGPEHITVDAPLTAGYYIVYVDPFSMHSDTATNVTIKLQIGGQLFTAPAHQFTTTSYDIYRAFDVTVDASGNVTVGSPNAGITVYAPPVMRAPKF